MIVLGMGVAGMNALRRTQTANLAAQRSAASVERASPAMIGLQDLHALNLKGCPP